MSITEKGVTAYRQGEDSPKIPESLNTWLQQLQLRLPKVSTYSPSIDLASIGATSYSTQSFTVTGLSTNDVVLVNTPALTAGLYLISYRVSAADTLSLTLYNSTAGSIDEAAAVFKIVSIRV